MGSRIGAALAFSHADPDHPMPAMRPVILWLRVLAAPLAPAFVCTAAAGEVHAQQASALDRFDPASVTGPFIAVPGATVHGQLRPFAGATLSVADEPLVLTRTGEPPVAIVDHQAILHVVAGVEVGRRGIVEVSAAGVVSQDGASSGLAAPPSSTSALGDLRLGGRLVVLAPDGHRPGAAVGLDVWLPTAADDTYAGAGVVRVAPRVVAGVDGEHYAWGLTAASRLQPSRGDDLPRSEVEIGAAIGPRFGPVWVGAEVVTQVLLDGAPSDASELAAEARAVAKVALGPVVLGLAAGPGLGDAHGTPAFRVLGTVGVAVELDRSRGGADAPAAADDAGTPPPRQATPEAGPAGPADGPRAVSAFPCGGGNSAPACPPDADGDGVADAADTCRAERGRPSLDAARNGCPVLVDADRDGIPDGADGCPREAGPANDQPAAHGCPTTVRFDGSQIVMLQQVQFETGSDALAGTSDAALAEVARVLTEHEDIARLAVDGHTDGDGDAAKNLLLSQRRALAVVRWLVDHGVDARRLEARGFGERRPVADGTTDEGRAKNRRVEFVVRKRTPLGKEGWRDGPVE